MSEAKIYILGGSQSDFQRNWARDGLDIYELFKQTLIDGLVSTGLDANAIQVGHIGNFVGELFAGQGQLGGFFGHVDAGFAGMPSSRHEAACASGSMAMFGLMRNVPASDAAENLRPAAWNGREALSTPFVWPSIFSDLIDEYDHRYGIDKQHLAAISEINFSNAKKNPNAQTRAWTFPDNSFTEDESVNPTVIGRMRKNDCGQITDGAAVVFLASEKAASEYAKKRGLALHDIPHVKGWGHKTSSMLAEQKLQDSAALPYIYPHVRQTFLDAYKRAGIKGIEDIDGLETHDCFNITQYMAIDHSGLTAPGESWKAIEKGVIKINGGLPINASGGLIGLGHPVGATGVRMVLDCYKQVTGTAGEYQIEQAKNMLTFNVGGSATTSACMVIGV